jgi:hypothetical protein
VPPPAIHARYATGAATRRLSKLLHLRDHVQDWEIETADPHRVAEFLDAYEGLSSDEDERFAMMGLLVASYDELLGFGADDAGYWERLHRHLIDRFDLHGFTVQYWSLPDGDDAEAAVDGFAVSGRMRQVMTTMYGPRERWPRRPFAVMRFVGRQEPTSLGVRVDSMDISDERDGTFALWWSKFGDRPCGTWRSPSVADAIAYASREFSGPAPRVGAPCERS